jgi:hypothetical protein
MDLLLKPLIPCGAALILAAAAGLSNGHGPDARPTAAPSHSIADVMKQAMKDGLLKKVAAGDASNDEQKQLVELLKALGENAPPRGTQESWSSKTAALVAAAEEVLQGREGAGAKLTKAADCRECHRAHKGL